MPDQPVTVAAYAAGASLAAITLFYVFGPTFFIDSDSASSGFFDSRKRTIVGLSNPANDCFINSVLQALAGLGDLRLYLIREVHRRALDGQDVYEALPPVLKKGEKPEKIKDLQRGIVTKGLKDMLDALNERPIYRKTITAKPMIETLERAYTTRISRNQQDAQEFLQIVLERLSDEYKAGEKARQNPQDQGLLTGEVQNNASVATAPPKTVVGSAEGFPFEGRIESQIQCMYCGFKTKPSASTFVSLTLNVPQATSTTLDKCFDILLKTEEIEDYRCDRCRLKHAVEWKTAKLASTADPEATRVLRQDVARLETAIKEDPEIEPKDVEMPPASLAPKRNIKKYMRITHFPKVIAIHLSRSVFDPRSYSTKNMAKVNYTERLRLGGILNEHWYRLLGVVCHKGNHNSGHYESYRRNLIYPPFATPDAWSAYAAASKVSSLATSPVPIAKTNGDLDEHHPSPSISDQSLTPQSSPPATATSTGRSEPMTKASGASSLHRTITQTSRPQITTHGAAVKSRYKKKHHDRWWRVSDDKIKEARTSDVLGMQREVYLLFYELEKAEVSVED